MRPGQYGWSKDTSIFQQHAVFSNLMAPVTPQYGALNLGEAPFDGLSLGAYSGPTSGTILAVNATSGFSGDIIHLQRNGNFVFSVDGGGHVYSNGWFNCKIDPSANATSPLFIGGGSTSFSGSASGTVYAAACTSSFTGNLVDLQVNNVSKFSLSSAGSMTVAAQSTFGPNAVPFPLTNSISKLSSNVTLSSTNTFFDGPSLTCTAGTWLLVGAATIHTTAGGGASVVITTKLWDGTTSLASTETHLDSSGGGQTVSTPVSTLVSPVSTTTYKISVSTNTTGTTTLQAATTNVASGNTATYLLSIRIA